MLKAPVFEGVATWIRRVRDPSVRVSYSADGHDPTSLLCYVVRTCPTLIEETIAIGANPNEADGNGITPLMVAIVSDWTEDAKVVRELIRLGANVPRMIRDRPLMFHAVLNTKNRAVLETLVRHGASLEERDDLGDTPLLFAVRHSFDVLEPLVHLGADPTACTPDNLNALHIRMFKKDCPIPCRWADALVRLGVDINGRTKDGLTPLDAAASTNRSHDIVTLLRLGANLSSAKDPSAVVRVAAIEILRFDCPKIIRMAKPYFGGVHLGSRDYQSSLPTFLENFPILLNLREFRIQETFTAEEQKLLGLYDGSPIDGADAFDLAASAMGGHTRRVAEFAARCPSLIIHTVGRIFRAFDIWLSWPRADPMGRLRLAERTLLSMVKDPWIAIPMLVADVNRPLSRSQQELFLSYGAPLCETFPLRVTVQGLEDSHAWNSDANASLFRKLRPATSPSFGDICVKREMLRVLVDPRARYRIRFKRCYESSILGSLPFHLRYLILEYFVHCPLRPFLRECCL